MKNLCRSLNITKAWSEALWFQRVSSLVSFWISLWRILRFIFFSIFILILSNVASIWHQDRIERMAQMIRSEYDGTTIHLICILKGGSAFFEDLCHALRAIHRFRYITILHMYIECSSCKSVSIYQPYIYCLCFTVIALTCLLLSISFDARVMLEQNQLEMSKYIPPPLLLIFSTWTLVFNYFRIHRVSDHWDWLGYFERQALFIGWRYRWFR